MVSTTSYPSKFSMKKFWDKVKRVAKKAGATVLSPALKLYYTLEKPETPAWAKATIVGALGYFIFPLDAIPDFTPVIGYSDDIAVMIAALGAVAMHVDEAVNQKARQKLRDWFGADEIKQLEA